MKTAICVFLSVYILLLSGLPCADGDIELRAESQIATLATDDHPHPTNHAGGDQCSPLCVCSCCGTVVDTPSLFQFSYLPKIQFRPSQCFGPVTTDLSAPTLPTWQPPQLG
ncbi:DUF6660 family protein [Spirosoma sp. SC4-14]|uniref:DUF6660 family protein n=1 Tax=Spirosoma sp. SC4-14 TaxID=3128900 RepID=UPI0030CCF1A5